jgi:hypothetical protein
MMDLAKAMQGKQGLPYTRGLDNIHLYVAVSLPTLALITSLIVSMFQISGVREDIREIRTEMRLLTGKVYELMGEKR